jgi:hypothetical protein
MYAVEFRAKVEKDGTIQVPPQYRERLEGDVKVIVLAEFKAARGNLIDHLLEQPLQVAGFEPLSREASHARD